VRIKSSIKFLVLFLLIFVHDEKIKSRESLLESEEDL